MDNNVKKENNLEKSIRNENDCSLFLVAGAIAKIIVPEIGALSILGTSALTTYINKPIMDHLNNYKTPLKDMPIYAIKNSARCLIGATAVSMWKYFF